jgi:hypothetical protein
MKDDLPYEIFQPVSDDAITEHLITMFKPEFQANYFVKEATRLHSGEWIIRLVRKLESKPE